MTATPGPPRARLVVLGGSAPATVQLVDALAGLAAGQAGQPAGPPPAPPVRLELVLCGRSEQRLAAVAGAARRRAAGFGLDLPVSAHASRATALAGADIVLCQIRPGGLEQRSGDESFPREFGIPGEETLGPGGFACAVRAVAALRPVWADVVRYAPRALVINLTNPAGIVTQAARREFGLEVIAVCDSPLGLLASAAVRLGLADPSGASLRTRYAGLNHVGWYVPASADELDALAGLTDGLDPDVPRLHGALPGSYLRYYVHPDRMLAAQRGRPTRADELREVASSMLVAFGRGELPPSWPRPAPWYRLAVLPLVLAWLRGSAQPLLLGLPNAGRVPWLPGDVIVEAPVAVPRPGVIEPAAVAALPDIPRGLLARHASFERLAAVSLAAGPPSDEDMVRVLLANPLVTSLDQARALAAAIAARMADYDAAWR